MRVLYLDLLAEEVKGGGLSYALPSSAEAWEAAIVNHVHLIVPCELSHLTPPCTLGLELAVISRENATPSADLVPILKRDAPSLFTRYRGQLYELDDDGNRITSQTWRHPE